MNSKVSLCFFIFFLFFFSIAGALDITKLLDKYPAFSKFNSYLTQTQVAAAINSRRTITVLAVDNDNISPLTGKTADVLRKVMSLHVVLGYFDVQKLQNLQNKGVTLTTLYKSSGQAAGQQGFLKATKESTGGVVIRAASAGSNHGANVVKSVVALPYNISILQVSTVVVPLGGEKSQLPGFATSPAISPIPATGAPTPASSPSEPEPMPPASSPSEPKPPPAKSPIASSPMPISAPTPSDAPAEAPKSPLSPAPVFPPMASAPAANAPVFPAMAPAPAANAPVFPPTAYAPVANAPVFPPMASAPAANAPVAPPMAAVPAANGPAEDSPSADTALQLGVSVFMIAVAFTAQLLLTV